MSHLRRCQLKLPPKHLPVAGVIILITLLGYFFFPGHTYLQQDNQIYVPILEHLWDNTVLANDPIAVNHHVTFTIYDELALLLRRLTGLGFREILVFDQLLARALGILGVYLIATALGLSSRMALVAGAVYALGATVSGPSVLSVEYEPKPRGSALPLIMLAVGLMAHGRYLAGAIAGSVAFLYHPPTACAFWAVYFCMAAWPSAPEVMKRRLLGLAPFGMAVVVLFVLSRYQIGGPEPQPLLSKIDPELEQLQRMRASYSWVSLWISKWIGHYLFLWGVSIAALLRLRKVLPPSLRFFMVGLPLAGMLSLPAAYLLQDQLKWALMPKFQPARVVLFVSAMAVVLAIVAALRAAQSRKIPEALLWGAIAFAIPIQARVSDLLLPDLSEAVVRRRVAIMLLLAGLAAAAAWLQTRRPVLSWVLWSMALVAPFLLIPYYGKVVNHTRLDHPELGELSVWAQASTAKDAVFLFADAGKGRHPGVFRGRALRAVYVDWKGGGQVNMVKEFGSQWWNRWQQTLARPFEASEVGRYRGLGIDYIVVAPANRLANGDPLFENGKYLVYGVS